MSIGGLASRVLVWGLGCGAVGAQPIALPFTIGPAPERAATRGVPVTIVFDAAEVAAGEAWYLRLVPSGRTDPPWRLDGVKAWRAGESPVVLEGAPGEWSLLVLVDGHPGYRLAGPFRWPDRPEVLAFDPQRRRTILGPLRRDSPVAPSTWVSGAALPESGPWPACAIAGGTWWECIGVAMDEPGVLLVASGHPVRFAVAAVQEEPATRQPAAIGEAAWCRLLRVAASASPWTPPGALAIEPLRRRDRRQSRLAFVPDDRVTVEPLAADAFWVCGLEEPAGGVLRIRGMLLATVDLAFDGWHRGPPDLAHELGLPPAVPVTGRVEDARGDPAPHTHVVVSRVPPRESGAEQDAPGPPEYLVEVTAGGDGTFDVPGLGEGTYEFGALHPHLGRAVTTVDLDGRPIVIRLAPARRARGRVLRDRQPASGVSVGVTPDLASYRSGADAIGLASFSTVTDDAGRFDVDLPADGSSVVRVGDDRTGVVRIPLPPESAGPAVVDLGDIELRPPIAVTVEIDGAAGCVLTAAGPFGSSGLTVARGQSGDDGRHVFRLPEPGRWILDLTCAGRGVALAPPLVDVPAGEVDVYARVAIRPGG